MKKLTTRVFYRITAEPGWGIDRDIIFGAIVSEGVLNDLRFYSEDETKEKAEFIMSASRRNGSLFCARRINS